MQRKWIPYLLVALLALTLFFVRRCNFLSESASPANQTSAGSPKKTAAKSREINRNRGFDRRISYIEYSRHARCRMVCRHISQAEVESIMQTGSVNYSKSDVKAYPCPEYALEGNTADGQRVRIVFAQCDKKTKVVTTIDLGEDWPCDCPGDDTKSRKR